MSFTLVQQHTRSLGSGNAVTVHQYLRKRSEHAKGLPVKGYNTPFPSVPPGRQRVFQFVVQDHDARRAGRHFDLRLGDGRTGIAHSWAIPKAKLPEPGEVLLAVPSGDHTIGYMDYRGRLGSGYGSGSVAIHKRGLAEVVYASADVVKFAVHEGHSTSEYVLRKATDKAWLILNVTPTRRNRPDLPSSKPSYREVDPDSIDTGNDNQTVQAKIDGAHVLVSLKPGQQTRVFSYRPTERATGVIDHTYRIPGVVSHRSSDSDTILRGEAYATDYTGKALPAAEIGGMLNAGVWNSRILQATKGQLGVAVFDVVKHNGKNVENAPYAEKEKIIADVVKKNAKILHTPDTARTKEEKERLLTELRSGRHPQSKEGFVVWDNDNPIPAKAKFRPDHDVTVRGVFKAYDKNGKELDRAGGFEYSWGKGPVVGKVGTGFDHGMLRAMKEHPERFIGRVAKVRATDKFDKTTALRAPSFSEWHIDKGKQ